MSTQNPVFGQQQVAPESQQFIYGQNPNIGQQNMVLVE